MGPFPLHSHHHLPLLLLPPGLLFSFTYKQVRAATREQVEAATHEIAVMEALHHPNLLPLVASSIVPFPEGHHVVYMLFPLFQVGARVHLFHIGTHFSTG
jgi:hypothetical protein